MYYLELNKDNMLSFLMGKNVSLPWRGQQDVCVYIPFDEWRKCISENLDILSKREPIHYKEAIERKSDKLLYRYFMYDCGWSLFNEVMLSSNAYSNATAIFPKFDNGKSLSVEKLIEKTTALSSSDIDKYLNRYLGSYPKCINTPVECMTAWNYQLYLSSLYLQSFAYGEVEHFTIDWR